MGHTARSSRLGIEHVEHLLAFPNGNRRIFRFQHAVFVIGKKRFESAFDIVNVFEILRVDVAFNDVALDVDRDLIGAYTKFTQDVAGNQGVSL